jgi:phospholipid-binding lipoprotein MlaA
MRSMTNSIGTANGKTAILWLAVGWSAFALLTGCATMQSADPEVPDNDPFESVNRPIYRANDFIDRRIAKPVTEAYVSYTPQPVQNSVSNFFDNVVYPNVILNDFLQGKGTQGLEDLGRFLVNTTFGFLGVWDMATPLGLEAHDEDFGQTLGVWGMDESIYLVLPFIGPSTVRDVPNLGVSTVTNILFYVPSPYVVPVALLGFIDLRARLEEAITFRDETAVEPYLFTREAYLQHRKFLIYDGNPPVDDDLYLGDPFDDLDVEEEPLQEETGNAQESTDRND